METSYLILLILAIVYVPFYFWVRISPKAKRMGLSKYGPMVMIRTKFGTRLMDRYCVYKRFWYAFGVISIIVSIFLMIVIIFMVVVSMSNLLSNFGSSGMGVEYALAIPGINPILPLWYGILGLIVAMVFHELAHGMQTRANGMRVDSTGLLHCVVPMGAFVEPNEEDVKNAPRTARLHLYAAGITTNFFIAIIAFTLMSGVMFSGVTSEYGDDTAVYSITYDSPADHSNIPAGAIITQIDGMDYRYTDDYTITYSWEPGDIVTVTYVTENGTLDADLRWGLYIDSVASNSPAEGILESGMILTSMEIDGVKTLLYTQNAFASYMEDTCPNDTVTFTYIDAHGIPGTAVFDLGSKGSIGFVGIVTSTSGMVFSTPNTVLSVATNPFYGADTPSEMATAVLGYISGPLNGFDPVPEAVEWWYDTPLGDLFWILASILYWIFWLNIMLGVTNALPAIPFDGGFIFRDLLDSWLERLGMRGERKDNTVNTITSIMTMLMLTALMMMILAIIM